jgi:tetratricopeptide (TPR) repeat protein
VDTLLKIGLLYEEKRDFAQAQRSYEAALSYNDKNVKIFQHLAWCSFQNNNIPTALDHISKAEKREEDNPDTYYIKGRCYLAINNISEASDNFSKAIEKTQNESTYLISYAVVLYFQNKYEEAFNTILKA